MKLHLFKIAMLVPLALSFAGCTGDKIQVIHNANVVTNFVPTSAFNDEHYVWESWQFSTNQVGTIESAACTSPKIDTRKQSLKKDK